MTGSRPDFEHGSGMYESFAGYYDNSGAADIHATAQDFFELNDMTPPDGFVDSWIEWYTSDHSTEDGGSTDDGSAPDELGRKIRKAIYFRPRALRSTRPAVGLVLGSVQAGKTTSYTDLMEDMILGAEDGRPGPDRFLFVVLTGVHERLRRQTEVRLRRDLGDLLARDLISFPFAGDVHSSGWEKLRDATGSPVLTVKKVHSRLNHAKALLENVRSGILKENCLIVIIDDECDQITVDTARQRKPNSVRITDLVWSETIRENSHGVLCLGYSATPFANLMLSTQRDRSMFPRDMIHNLEPGEGYMGLEHFFPDGGTCDIVTIPVKELAWRNRTRGAARMTVEEGTALEEALTWFLIAAAAKRRVVASDAGDHGHTSMLVHMYTRVSDHRMTATAIRSWLDAAGRLTDAELEGRLTTVAARCTGEGFSPGVDVGSLPSCGEIRKVLEDVQVVEDHSQSTDRLDYSGPGRTVIAVGGHTLSRGLTLHGLVSSYFCRSGDFAYDTFLQFSRWFGYRPGYEHLPRVWLTKEDQEAFRLTGRVEGQLRADIAQRADVQSGEQLEDAIRVLIDGAIGMLPSKTLDSARLVGTYITAGTPTQIRTYSPSDPRWDDTLVEKLLTCGQRRLTERGVVLEQVDSTSVLKFLEAETVVGGKIRLIDLAGPAVPTYDSWDVVLPLPKLGASGSDRTFVLAGEQYGRWERSGVDIGGGVRRVPEFTDEKWRDSSWILTGTRSGSGHAGDTSGRDDEDARADRPLLILAPLEVGEDGGRWDCFGAAIILPDDSTLAYMQNPTTNGLLKEVDDELTEAEKMDEYEARKEDADDRR